MELCSVCGFPLGTRPGLMVVDGECGACVNNRTKCLMIQDNVFQKRQEWLTKYIQENKTNEKYDCVIAVSGGKDSHAIVKRLYENHGVKNALLVSVTDEFTHTKAGKHNIDNLVCRYNCDLITFRCSPITFKQETLKDFENELHPLKWIEEKIYSVPVEIAKNFGIKLVFFGENSSFEYGTSTELEIIKKTGEWFLYDFFDPDYGESDFGEWRLKENMIEIIYMGAIYPYSITDSLEQAKSIGFKDLDDMGEWKRQGSIDQFTQIDSIGYLIQLFTKYCKFGFQRVADIACRYVREGIYTREKARLMIDAYDYMCDPEAKADFCKTLGISHTRFNEIVDKHANRELVEKKFCEWHSKV